MIRETFSKLFFPHDGKPEHFKALDGLRGLAVLLVILSHSSNQKMFAHELLNFQRIGKAGVYLFFVLSAYLLDRQIALAFMSNGSSKAYWKNYFLRRFLRIYPLFVIALLFHGLFTMLGIRTAIDTALDIPHHMLLLKGESIFWSIPVEFKYYFISPVIMWFCHKHLKWDKRKLFFVFVAAISFAIIAQSKLKFPSVSTLRYLPIFLVGTLISIYELIDRNEVIHNIKPRIFDVAGIIALALVLLTAPYYFEMIFGFKLNFHKPMFYIPYAVLWGLILLAAKYGKGGMKALLELRFLRFLGSISFSMYLFHIPFLRFVKQMSIAAPLKFYVFLLLTMLFSSVTFLLIERPLSKIRIHSRIIPGAEKNKNTSD